MNITNRIDDDLETGSCGFDATDPERAVVHVYEDDKSRMPGWRGWSLKVIEIIPGARAKIGMAQYEHKCGYFDWTIKITADCPKAEGLYMVENITGSFEYTWDGMRFVVNMDTVLRPLTPEECVRYGKNEP